MKIRDFDELPIATDGKVLVGASGTICTTDSDLSDIIGDLIVPATSGKVDKSTYAEDKAATEQDIAEIGTSLDTKLDTTAFNAAVSAIDEDLESLGGDLDGLDGKIDAVSGIVASDYALSADVSTALTGKEDKVFVAEYNVTTYDDIKTAYDAGKKIVCKYNITNSNDQSIDTYYLTSVIFDSNPGLFVFAKLSGPQDSIQIHIGNNIPWYVINQGLQSKLTFAGENNTITAINTSAVGQTLAAGTDLVINNGVIGVNTNGTVSNSANMEFVAGSGTSANGEGAIALGFGAKANDKGAVAVGIRTSANGMGAHAEGYETSAIHVDGSLHAEGSRTYASNEGAHAEGISAKAKGKGSHAEGLNTSANGFYAHAEGNKTFAAGENSHAEGSGTSAWGRWTHAEGCSALAYSDYSHAEGYGTIASSPYMHVGGLYNATTANALFVIGNGSSNDRSDAFTVNGSGLASATKLATSGIPDVETEVKSKLDSSAIQFVSTSGEAVTGTQGVIYIVTGTNS